jgi:hypothetical protein
VLQSAKGFSAFIVAEGTSHLHVQDFGLLRGKKNFLQSLPLLCYNHID